ncbi:MAG: chemotaxis-specific protein-glutamate methyltransferase CheB [Planctomycetes bacterium]|nr:chemotaxis-specific protein-glutamate methyltransferase CheB [Planctomycetota bacterium]
MSEGTVRVLIVDDSAVQRAAFRRHLEAAGLEVVAEASDGDMAVRKVLEHLPQVVLMDVRMPGLDGLQATQRIMARRPTPILLVTASPNLQDDADIGLRALELGALELIAKPDLSAPQGPGRSLAQRLRLLAQVPVISHVKGNPQVTRRPTTARKTSFHRRARSLVTVVASTGGPRALRLLLSRLPADLRAAVVIVQHIDGAFEQALTRWLDAESELEVALAKDEQDLYAGCVYLAPQGFYAEVTPRRRLALVEGRAPLGGHCPNGDRLFSSAADAYGSNAIGVVLTGMGSDGTEGLLALKQAGALTIAQDEASSVIFGMPGAAVAAGACGAVLPLEEIPDALIEALRERR